MSVYGDIDPETFISVMKLKHSHNNIHAIIFDEKMPLEGKVRALGDIQREMKEREEKDLARLWGEISRATGRDLSVPKPGFHTTVYSMLKASFDSVVEVQQSGISNGIDTAYETDLLFAIYFGKLLVQYEQQYPEYCTSPRSGH